MRLTIIAASGGIGQHLLQQALAAGHDVTAVVRSPKKITAPVRVVQADLADADPAALALAVKGADAVLSGLGARTSAEAGVAWRGTQAVVDAMRSTEVRRIVVVSAAPIGTVPSPERPHPPKHDPGDGFFMRHLGARFARTAFRTHYADLAHMEDVLRDSGLDWTISRPPKLTDKPLTGHYRTAIGQNIRGGFSISRADVAHHMLHVINDDTAIRQVIGVAT
ncbi:MAG: NAD(P)-dependent oxidoreductase [Catenulispora sp.]